MAITTIATPQPITPAFNQCKFIYNSTNKNNEGFRYIFDIYPAGGVDRIAEYRVLPTFGTGYGQIDISKLLGSKVGPDFLPLNYTFNPTANTTYEYDVKVGEEYIVTYTYTSNLTNNSGNVKITPTAAHTFVVGDQVVVDAGTNTLITGLWVVVAVTGTTDFTISALWTNVTDPTENGSVTYADKRKTITRDIEVVSDLIVFNGARSWVTFTDYVFTDYILDNSGAQFLTSCPTRNFYITPFQEMWFNGFTMGVSGKMVFTNSNGDVFKYDVTSTDLCNQLCVASPQLLLDLLSGTYPLIKDDTEWYDVYFIDASVPTDSQTYRFNIDQRCRINDYSLLFLDRMGSWGSFAFSLRAYENGTNTKQSFNKDLEGFVSDGQWTYGKSEAGLTTYSSIVEKTLQLNGDWITEEMSVYFQELITSPIVYLFDGGNYYQVIVTDNSFEVNSKRNKNLFKKSVTVKYANQDKVNI